MRKIHRIKINRFLSLFLMLVFLMGPQSAEVSATSEEPEGTSDITDITPSIQSYTLGTDEVIVSEVFATDEEPEGTSDITDITPSIQSYTLGTDEVIVYNHSDLKSALGNNNGITKVYFGADIMMESGGIAIHSSKTEVQISGLDPTNPNQITPYTLTEYDSNYTSNTISLASSGTLSKLLVSDLKIVGKNYYGSFYMPDASSNAGRTVVYERVIYNGPQMIYHRYGTSHLIDCDVTIAGTNTTNSNQEFGEVGNLVFEGKNTISTSTITSNSVFYYPYITNSTVGSFEIKDQSSLTLIANNYSSSTDRGIFYTGGSTSTYGIDVAIGMGSELNLKTTASLVGYGTLLQSNFKSFTVKQDGAFNLETTTACTTVMYTTGAVTVADGASFIINSTGNGNSSGLILNQTTGNITVGQGSTFHLVAAGTYSRLLQLGSGYKLECNDPASGLLYNPGGRMVQSASSTCSLSINAQQVNYWTGAGNGGFENPPLYHWKNGSGNVSVTANVGTAGATSNVSHNYTGSEYDPPSSTTFSMASARVLSFGRLELTVDELYETSTPITGTTAPGATVRASYEETGGSSGTLADVTADDGSYSTQLSTAYTQDTEVTVKSTFQYLYAEVSTVVEAASREYTVSLSLDSSATWDDLLGNVGVTFSSGSARQTAFFDEQNSEYTGYPEDSSSKAITILSEGSWTVTLHLPIGYNYAVYKKGSQLPGKSLDISASDAMDCHIEIVISKESEPPWGKQIYKSISS